MVLVQALEIDWVFFVIPAQTLVLWYALLLLRQDHLAGKTLAQPVLQAIHCFNMIATTLAYIP
jgi:hypothetical protein